MPPDNTDDDVIRFWMLEEVKSLPAGTPGYSDAKYVQNPDTLFLFADYSFGLMPMQSAWAKSIESKWGSHHWIRSAENRLKLIFRVCAHLFNGERSNLLTLQKRERDHKVADIHYNKQQLLAREEHDGFNSVMGHACEEHHVFQSVIRPLLTTHPGISQ